MSLLCKLGAYREAYGDKDTSALNFSVLGRTIDSGTSGGAIIHGIINGNNKLRFGQH